MTARDRIAAALRQHELLNPDDTPKHHHCECGWRASGYEDHALHLADALIAAGVTMIRNGGRPMTDSVRYLFWRIRQRLFWRIRQRAELRPCRGCDDNSFHTHHLTWLGRRRWTR